MTALSLYIFHVLFKKLNISIFKPKKDQCDTCTKYNINQLDEKEYTRHRLNIQVIRNEKKNDKMAAESNRRHMFAMDVQAVKLCPNISASAVFYKQRLQVHNFTIYNLASHQCTNYWWNETEANLSSSVFITCIINHLTKHCLKDTLPITIISDGCGYQNRNVYLASAISEFAEENNKIVQQLFLEKGHTQMECDSVHANIEKKLRYRNVYTPTDYVEITSDSRQYININGEKKCMIYDGEYLPHTYFNDYSKNSKVKSIRPKLKNGKSPTVNQIRALIYLPDGQIKYKCDMTQAFADLNQKNIRKNNKKHKIKPLFNNRLKITSNKYKHLQQLKEVIPEKYHRFYNDLPHI